MMKALLLVLALFASTFATHAQVLNGSFEDLTDTLPSYWNIADLGADLQTQYLHSGSQGLAVWNWYYYSKGYAINGNTDPAVNLYNKMPGAGTPTTEKALRLTGYYYYDTTQTDTEADTALITVAYRTWNANTADYDTVAWGMKYFMPTAGTGMEPFSIDIEDMAPGTDPDTVVIVLRSSLNGFCNTLSAGNCLYFYVDDLALENTTGTTDVMAQFARVQVYPNPATGRVTLVAQQPETHYRLLDVWGREHLGGTLQPGNNTVDVSAMASGVYLLGFYREGEAVAWQKLVVR